jgi:hypothetical protein
MICEQGVVCRSCRYMFRVAISTDDTHSPPLGWSARAECPSCETVAIFTVADTTAVTDSSVAYSDPPIRILPIVECVSRRPTLFTPHGTLAEVISYLEGYDAGLRRGQKDEELAEWEGFRHWMTEKLVGNIAIPWHRALRQCFPNDREALAQLLALFGEFHRQRDT